ncbi:hypothetical protein [Mesorhizobium onobrychidis]|uniref:Uncharacterized protein n=1 Tax=Mesorhizobium onobrychidis TaxID=2775404 RepID=A0ABY5R796_9HYPH|nr:hypothetical protein [Mesorhizobium onobrychidis]UVC19351.1 hypothetical protein IHQ72_36245 [Mesorhizobium onobrychidis]
MTVLREEQRFPTRSYPYRKRAVPMAAAPDVVPALANVLYRRVGGIDVEPRPMDATELGRLDDPFGRLLRSGKPFPLTTRLLIAAFDAIAGTADELPQQLVFLVADGGHIPWTPQTEELRRGFRFVIARGKGDFTLLVSSSTVADSAADQAFLQVIGWDDTNKVFHFYERLAGTYFWAGMSTHALQTGTRGKGPFDSHVNGATVMKELRTPWVHWHAPQAGINENALAPDDPLRNDPLFMGRVSAERMEAEVARPGVRRWNAARIARAVDADGTWRDVRHFLRQAVTDTTVNLATSQTASHLIDDTTPLRPPLTFFLNSDTLFGTLGLEPNDPSDADISVPGRLYRECLARYDIHRSDGALRIEGDSHFAFLTPEPAFEDTHLIDALVQAGLLTRRLVAALTMTDFPNPVFSPRRAALLRHVPTLARGPNAAEALESEFVAAVRAAADHQANRADSPEREFLSNYDTDNFDATFRQRIAVYLRHLKSGMADPETWDGWFRLAEYRRRRFRRKPLAEFALTTPRSNIAPTAAPLRMTALGRAEPLHPSEPDETQPPQGEIS